MKMRTNTILILLMFLVIFTQNIVADLRLDAGEISAGSGFANQIPIHWAQHSGGTISEYRLYRKITGEEYELIETLISDRIHTIDYNTDPEEEYIYKIAAVINGVEVDSINESDAICTEEGFSLNFAVSEESIPIIDGIFEESEWDDATEIDITNYTEIWTAPLPENTLLYIKYHEETMYFAVKDYNDLTRDANDQIIVLFDFNNDGFWTADDGDGRFILLWNSVQAVMPLYIEMVGSYPNTTNGNDYYDLPFINASIEEGDDCLVYEVSIDLSNNIFEIDPENLGIMFECLAHDTSGDINVTGLFPNNAIWSAASTFLNSTNQINDDTIIEGNVSLTGGTGNIEYVVVTADGYATNPDSNGNYLLEVIEGIYDITASLEGYISQTIEDIEIFTGTTISNIDFELMSNVGTNEETFPVINELINNYPNPFNPSTTISFSLNAENIDDVELIIYNMKGQKVKTFSLNSHPELIEGSIIWDGTDQTNRSVSSGIYFYKLKTGNFEQTKKMLLVK